jgi:CHASE3 domain sensor protein|tara:strand:+ start:326 stop:559 length:234 start_codon:yes stop_codon:yes gene_type:complete
MDASLLWSGALTVILGVLGWALRSFLDEMQRVQILLNRTREEMAREYVTKAEAKDDIDRILDRLERLDEKLDRLMAR